MAEMAMQFVFGRSVGRDDPAAPPAAESWPVIVRETWPQGVSFLVFSAAHRRCDGPSCIQRPCRWRDLVP